MARLIAVSGLAGAGKTTAIDYLEKAGFGRRVYVGQFILDAVAKRNLPPGPDSERQVRSDLRNMHGPAVYAQLAAPHIDKILKSNCNVLLDAIFGLEELNFYRSNCDADLELVFISVSFEIRAARLAERVGRSLNADELRKRDEYEQIVLGLDKVCAEARLRLVNQSSRDAFCNDLETNCFSLKT